MRVKIGVIAEDDSDVETLKVFIRRLANDDRLPVKGSGFDGCGRMLHKGSKHLDVLLDQGYTHFVVAYDSDGHDPEGRFVEAATSIVAPSQIDPSACCIVVPVQEIEAWLLADLANAVPKVFKGWRNPPEFSSPEAISSPKERLAAASRGSNRKPRYANAVHNPHLAKHVELDVVRRKCPSFRQLDDFIRKGHCRPPFPIENANDPPEAAQDQE